MTRLTSYESVLRSLELSRETVLSQAEFYASYARMVQAAPPPRDEHDRGWSSVAHSSMRWLGSAVLASSYRRAAQYAILVETRWATLLGVRAAQAYVAAGLPFGLFLLAGLLDDRTLGESDAIRASLNSLDPVALRDPVQQMYLLLIAASRPWLRDSLADMLDGAVQHLDAHSLQPIGPQGIPLGEYLDLATIMLNDELATARTTQAEIRDISRRLAVLYRAQAASLRSARRNRYLWRSGAAPINVVELEYAAMYGLALRHRPWAEELSAVIAGELGDDEVFAEVPIWITDSIDAELPAISSAIAGALRHPPTAAPARADWTPDRTEPADPPDWPEDGPTGGLYHRER